MITCEAKVVSNREVKPGCFLLRLICPQIAQSALPGQFALLRCSSGHVADPLLRRPLSFQDANEQTGEIAFLYQVRGKGTQQLSRFGVGQTVSTIGPLGEGFQLKLPVGPIAIIAGGVGIAPLAYLARVAYRQGYEIYTFLGARSKSSLLADPGLVTVSTGFFTATDDGTCGLKGNLVQLLQTEMQTLARCCSAYICGPEAAMQAAVSLCTDLGVPCQVSLESVMACGVGACLGCTCRTTRSTNYSRVCTQGPVFDGREVVFGDNTEP